MFSPEYYSKLDPSYREALTKLEAELKHPGRQAQRAALDFMGKYMPPQEVWDSVYRQWRYLFWFRSPNGRRNYPISHLIDSFFYKAVDSQRGKKYYDSTYWPDYNSFPVISTFPNKYMDKRLEQEEKKVYSFIPRDVYQRHEEMKELYLKIKEAEGDTDEWFAALLEAKDHQFVCDNVEYRLNKDLTDKKLWIKYIHYLKRNDFKILLPTYSKYCRFFTDDNIMKEEYHAAAKSNGLVSVPWTNPYDFEVSDDKFWEAEELKQHQINLPENEPLAIQFIAVNPAKPAFPFLSPTIRYILDNANAEVLQNLFKTCKWFRARLPVNVCYKFLESDDSDNIYLETEEPLKFIQQSIKSSNSSFLNTTNIGELFISTVFGFCSNNPNALSALIPRFYRCTAKYVDIRNQRLSMEELKFLIGYAVDLRLDNVKNSDGNEFKLEDILQLTPNIKRLWFSGVQLNAETFQKLTLLEFHNKLNEISFYGLNLTLIDPVQFAEFVKTKCCSNVSIELVGNDFHGYQIFVDAIKEHWKDEEEKPYIYIE